MKRKLLVVLLSVVMCLGVVPLALAQTDPGQFSELSEYEQLTGKKLEFSEAPMLRTMVAAGELPDLEERLPKEPLVVTPIEEIGQYGGALTMSLAGPDRWYPATQIAYEPMLMLDHQTNTKVIPNIAKGWNFSDDDRTLTLYLREGMKWSDGAPFTADDITFWWEDIILNDDITPVKPTMWMPGGELMEVIKIDDYTVEYQFAVSYPDMLVQLSSVMERGSQTYCFAPGHALKNYHIKYNTDANELAKEEGYDNWWELFGYKSTYSSHIRRGGIPTVDPWIVEKESLTGVTFGRNPYYWKVDTDGNQLPYIDEVKGSFYEDLEVLTLKVLSGEVNFEPLRFEGSLDQYPLYKKNEEKGGYRIWLAHNTGRTSQTLYAFNQAYEADPVLREIFQNAKFRQAMSLGINREEINNIMFFGEGTPAQATIDPTASFYEEAWSESYAEYDPEEANRLLDEIGLERGEDGYRLRPDGETLGFTIHLSTNLSAWLGTTEIVKSNWEDLGVRAYIEVVPYSRMWQIVPAGEHQVAVWVMDSMSDLAFYANKGMWLGGSNRYLAWFAPLWSWWWMTKDQEEPTGQEPPEEIKALFAMCEELPLAGKEEKEQIARNILSLQAELIYYIGTVSDVPYPAMAAVEIRNIDEANSMISSAIGGTRTILAEQLFIKK